MLRTLDKVWFWIQDHVKGAEKGYNEGYEDGKQDGMLAQHLANLKELNAHEPIDFSDASYKLGYKQAIAVLKGDI